MLSQEPRDKSRVSKCESKSKGNVTEIDEKQVVHNDQYLLVLLDFICINT